MDGSSGKAMDAPPDISTWLDELVAELPEIGLDEVGAVEREVILELARIAAHRSHRTAAPISAYLLGLALAPLSRERRLARMRELVGRLDVPADTA